MKGKKDRGKNIPLFFLQFRCCCFHIDQEKWQFSMIIIFLLVLYISPTAASRTLVEYEIQMEHLQISSENNISKAELKFVFRRRMEFHVANTFLQTFLLTAVGSMSFYFDINNFGPKMQVTVTTMLVVATISNSIRNVRILIL